MADSEEFITRIIENAMGIANEFTDEVRGAAGDLWRASSGWIDQPPAVNAGFDVSAIEPTIPSAGDTTLSFEAQMANIEDVLTRQLTDFFTKYYPLEADSFGAAQNKLINLITDNGRTLDVDYDVKAYENFNTDDGTITEIDLDLVDAEMKGGTVVAVSTAISEAELNTRNNLVTLPVDSVVVGDIALYDPKPQEALDEVDEYENEGIETDYEVTEINKYTNDNLTTTFVANEVDPYGISPYVGDIGSGDRYNKIPAINVTEQNIRDIATHIDDVDVDTISTTINITVDTDLEELTSPSVGLSPEVAEQEWQRARERVIADGRRTERQLAAGYAAKGYTLVPGAMLRKIEESRTAQLMANGASATEIAAKQVAFALDVAKLEKEILEKRVAFQMQKTEIEVGMREKEIAFNVDIAKIKADANTSWKEIGYNIDIASKAADIEIAIGKLQLEWQNLDLERHKLDQEFPIRWQELDLDIQKYNLEPFRLDLERQKFNLEPYRLDFDWQKLSAEQQREWHRLDLERQKFNLEPHKLDFDWQKLSAEQQREWYRLDLERQKFNIDTKKFGIELQKLDIEQQVQWHKLDLEATQLKLNWQEQQQKFYLDCEARETEIAKLDVEIHRLNADIESKEITFNMEIETRQIEFDIERAKLGTGTARIELERKTKQIEFNTMIAEKNSKFAMEKENLKIEITKLEAEKAKIEADVLKIENDMIIFAIESAIKSRSMAMSAAGDYIKTMTVAPETAVKVAALGTDVQAKMMSAAGDFYRARLGRDELVLRSKLAELSADVTMYGTKSGNRTDAARNDIQALTASADAYARTASAAMSSINSIVSSATNAFS